jgi:molybdate transport system regulatory protein
MVHLTIRVDFDGKEGFGPGKARLLELVAVKGSIRRAAAAMEMSYRQAWLLLAAVERTFGAPVITTATGGTKGGGAKLTELGEAVLARYRRMERNALQANATEISAFAKGAGQDLSRKSAPKRTRRRLSPGAGS